MLAYWTGVQTLPPARLFSSWVLQDHRYEMVDAKAGGWSKTKGDIPPTRGRDTVKREVREEQEKNKDALLYGPMDEMRRKQLLIQRVEG